MLRMIWSFDIGDYVECCVALIWSTVWEEFVAVIIGMERIIELETTLAVATSVRDPMRRLIFINLPNPSGRTGPWGLLNL
jgi:hypothetical protein